MGKYLSQFQDAPKIQLAEWFRLELPARHQWASRL